MRGIQLRLPSREYGYDPIPGLLLVLHFCKANDWQHLGKLARERISYHMRGGEHER